MSARLIDGIKYIYLRYPHKLKTKSLEDDIYFTLTDMVWNGGGIHEPACSACEYIKLLSDIDYEKRDKNFKYKNVLYSDLEKILNLVSRILSNKERIFFFYEEDKYDNSDSDDDGIGLDMSKYIYYDDWFEHLSKLLEKLIERINK
jgi:hypothetical protein